MLIALRMDYATHPAYIRTLSARVDKDPALPLIFATLDAWAATSGRYGALDAIAGRAPSRPSVEDLWATPSEPQGRPNSWPHCPTRPGTP